jgi:fluoroquinolone transport system permease protein
MKKTGFNRFKYDLKLMAREPIMILFAVLPIFIMLLFRFGLPIAGQLLFDKTGFDLSLYNVYIFAMVIGMTPYMTGTLAGFLMLDEKDGNVLDLVLVTPVGFSGYLFSRMLIPIVVSLIYLIPGFILFSGYYSSVVIIPGIGLLAVMEGVITALLLFSIAANKVQGLTVAKGLGILLLPMFFDLFGNKFLMSVGYITPFYWIYAYIREADFKSLVIGIIVNTAWLLTMLILGFRRTYKIKTFSL